MSASVRSLVIAATVALCLGASTIASAQSSQAEQPRLAVSVGAQWLGSTSIGGLDAVETPNGRGTGTLFRTASEFRGGLGASGSVAVRLTRGLWAESSVRYHAARITTEVTEDVEGANGAATESLQHFQLEGGALLMPDAWQIGGSVQLFVSGGAGYVRQLHSGQTLAEDGLSLYAGAGVVIWLPQRPGRAFRAVGIRLDPRAVFLRDGVAFDDRLHLAPAFAASLFLRF